MTVSELISLLEKFSPDAELQIARGYDSSIYPMDEWDIEEDLKTNKVFIG